ncbi:Der1-like family-domain-containing protein [Podospora conica]|nr:Der1-like family-domain-containing protein [Schizothecium conicum]
MAEIMDAYWHAPPFARTLTTAIVATSLSIHILHVVPISWVYFDLGSVFKFPPEIWRFATAFFVSSPELGLIMDPYFAYQYLSQLERANTKFSRKEDMLWYLITVGVFIITFMRLATGYWAGLYLHGLTIAMCYTAVQDSRGQKSNFFFFNVPAQAIPYCMLAWSMIASPGLIRLQICGILSAHLHDFLTRLWPEFGMGPNLLPTPGFLSLLVQTPRFMKRDYGTAVRPKAGTSGATTGASTGPVLPDSWKTRGSGHRLG